MLYVQLLVGLIVLVLGGDFLVKGAVRVALRFNISPLVVGMTVVSLGTSAPELLVSLSSVLSNHPDIGVGAVIGSNISNLGLVLGLTVLIFPMFVHRDSLRIDWPMMMFSSILFYYFALDGQLIFWEGGTMFLLLVIFLSWIVYRSRKSGKSLAAENEVVEEQESSNVFKDIGFFVFGIIGLYFGSEWLIDAVAEIASSNGVSEKLISVTIVAFGTSVPELVTSLVAAFKKETDISIGNLIGSNVFNLMAILGITAIVHPLQVSDSMNGFDIFFMLGVSFILFPLMIIKNRLGRISGVILLLSYVFYIYFSIISEI